MAFLAGPQGRVVIGAASIAFGKWKLAMKAGTPKITNFLSGGYRELLSGIKEATITADGPYNAGSLGLTIGNAYQFTLVLGQDAGVSLSVAAILENLEPSQDVEDAARVSITAQSTGAFSISMS